MKLSEYAKYKRCIEWYSVDPEFRSLMESESEKAADFIGLDGKKEGEKLKNTIRTVLFDKESNLKESEFPYIFEYNSYCRYMAGQTERIHSRDEIPNFAIYKYLDTVRNRCRMESAAVRQNNLIYYYPFSFELSSGCTVQCPFCGLKAETFKGYFEYNNENATMFKRAVSIAKEYAGEIAGASPLYFASEPLDNLDYFKFVKDVIDITGYVPQTTTALADKYPERIKEYIGFLGEKRLKEYAALRFSIRSLPQFKKIMSLYTAEELVNVELLANNPESVNRYSASGKVLESDSLLEKKKTKYSICCTSGIKINFFKRTVEFIEPELPDENFPLGYSIKEKKEFTDADELESVLRKTVTSCYKECLDRNCRAYINSNVKIHYDVGLILFIGDGVGYKIFNNEINASIIQGFKEGKTFNEIVSEYEDGELEFAYETFQALYERGYIRH